MTTSTAKIYVDIDSILDIRQGILLELMDKDQLVKYLNNDEYTFRELDIFSNVDMEQYNNLETKRPVKLIPNSTITYIVNVLKTKIMNLEKRNAFYSETKKPEILLNVYPFKLSEQQQEDIQNLLFLKLGSVSLVTIIDKPLETITPFFLSSSNVISAFIYNFSKWGNLHIEALSKAPLKDISLYFPSIYYNNQKVDQLKTIKKLGFKDIYCYIEYLFSNTVDINFLPVVFYSNIVTATLILQKYDTGIKKTQIGDNDGNSSAEI